MSNKEKEIEAKETDTQAAVDAEAKAEAKAEAETEIETEAEVEAETEADEKAETEAEKTEEIKEETIEDSEDAAELEELDIKEDEDESDSHRKKDNIVKSLVKSTERFVLFSLLLIYCETVFHLWSFNGIDKFFPVKLVMCLPTAALLSLFTCFFKKKANQIVTWVLYAVALIYYVVNILYRSIFKVFFSTAFISKNNAKVAQYYREILEGIKTNWLVLLLIVLVPVVVLLILNKVKVYRYKTVRLSHFYVPATILALCILIEVLIITAYGKETDSPYDLCVGENILDTSFERLGVIATAEIETKNRLFSSDEADSAEDELEDVWVYKPVDVSDNNEGQSDTADVSDNNTEGGEEMPEPEAEPEPVIDRSPNMLDIDFVSLAENEPDEFVAGIHNYMSTLVPTNKNEYTGMFEGFNLIFMTAEGFSSIAVDEELTPTLYRLTHEGFVFTNFYNPRTGGSTSDGEFVCSTSLYPMLGGATNFKTVGQNSMPFSLGNLFNAKYGITSRAYHDNDYTYYDRDITYPGMGYYYQGIGNGLETEKHWPRSDLQMFEASMPEYVDDELFHVYYMTVSGHLNYNFTGNWCSKNNKEAVENLDLSEPCQAYLACQMELDKGLEYMINMLEEKGIADRTVICFTGDHWPYGLENEEFSELLGHEVEETFELYKSNLILWSGAIEEPIVIDKACCSMDILPTLLNLFGFDYDSRLLMGQDIFSDEEGFAPMWDRSIVTDTLMYDRKADTVVYLTEDGEPPADLPEDYLENLKKRLNLKRKYSERIMTYDYYKYIQEYLGIEYPYVEQNYVPDYSKFTKGN